MRTRTGHQEPPDQLTTTVSSAPWRRARGLTERVAGPRVGGRDEPRARAWAETLGSEEALTARLACVGLTRDELPALLADDDAADAFGEPEPSWWADVTAMLERDDLPGAPNADDEQDAELARGADRLVAPFSWRTFRELRAHPEGADGAALALARALAAELVELAAPTVATELALASTIERWEAGDTTRRTADALRALSRPERARALFEEQPGLARLLVDRTRLALQAGLELLDRVAADRPRVREELFDGADPGSLVAVSAAGDAHDGGRRVARLRFSSGAEAMLKPRSMQADAAYQRLLGALSEAGFEPALAPLRTLCAGPTHGWQQLAHAGGCNTEAEVNAYFRRLGGQLAVLYALRATDMHFENVLACGEHPAVIDLETVLHPRLGGRCAAAVDPLIAETGLDCVLRVGLLPRADVVYGVDMSGLGRDPGVDHVGERRRWSGTDAGVRLVTEQLSLEPGDNAPRLGGAPVPPAHYVEALAGGFARAYELLVVHRERWLAAGGPLAAFAGVPLRFILRSTKVYADLLTKQAQERDGLVDGLAREETLNVLWRGAARRPEIVAAAPAEHDDLWVGDVPKIGGHAGSADGLHHLHGTLRNLLSPHEAPGPEVVRRLDSHDLERQLAFVRSSVLASTAASRATRAHGTPAALGAADHATSARAAGERLAALALHDGAEAGWLAPVARPPVPGRVLRPVDSSLRHGQAGIALLLVRLRAVLRDAGAGELARAALLRLAPESCSRENCPAARLLLLAALSDLGAIAPSTHRAAATDLAAASGAAMLTRVAAAAPALAMATVVLGRDPQLVAAARTAAAHVSVVYGGLVALVAQTAATRIAAGTADEEAARAALDAALAKATGCGDEAGPTPRRLDLPVARADAGRVLGTGRNADIALSAEEREVVFRGGAESPVLEDGLAGIGLARLALAGDGPSTQAVTTAIVLRADADRGGQLTAG